MDSIQKIGQRIGRTLRLLYHSQFACFRMRNLKPPYPIRVGRSKADLNAEDSDESRGIYAEVVLYDGYGINSLSRREAIRRIVDIGANIGAFSVLASLACPDAEIQAFDPHPVAYQWLVRNVAGRKVTTFNVAVADKEGELRFDAKTHATISSLNEDGSHVVRAIAPSEIFPGQEIDFLKIDCEGAEFLIFQDTNLLKRTKRIAMEYHLDQINTFERLKELLQAGGHRIIRDNVSELAPQFGILWSERLS